MMAYAEQLREKMALPDLTTVMQTRIPPPMVNARTTVKEAAKLMKERRTTAVCVMETSNASISTASQVSGSGAGQPVQKIAGIFTSKDVVLRVIAAGLDAQRCSVVRVMTPHPDTAPPTMSVQDALKKMHGRWKWLDQSSESILTLTLRPAQSDIISICLLSNRMEGWLGSWMY